MVDNRTKRDNNFANLKANFSEMNNEIYTNNHLYLMDVRGCITSVFNVTHTQKIFHFNYY